MHWTGKLLIHDKSILMKLIRIVVFFLLTASGCTYENEEDLLGEDTCREDISFAQDVEPIISTHCAVPGCHVSGGQSPNFSQASVITNRSVSIKN